jgi:hypothetical protein
VAYPDKQAPEVAVVLADGLVEICKEPLAAAEALE